MKTKHYPPFLYGICIAAIGFLLLIPIQYPYHDLLPAESSFPLRSIRDLLGLVVFFVATLVLFRVFRERLERKWIAISLLIGAVIPDLIVYVFSYQNPNIFVYVLEILLGVCLAVVASRVGKIQKTEFCKE